MTDLSAWGGGIDPADDRPASTDRRCRALVADGRRCGESPEEALCPAHRGRDAITIDDDPTHLVGATAGAIWPDPSREIAGWEEIRAGLDAVSAFDWTDRGSREPERDEE